MRSFGFLASFDIVNTVFTNLYILKVKGFECATENELEMGFGSTSAITW